MDAAPRDHARLLFHRYGNRSGGSGVAGYALVNEGIAVKFSNGAIYVYDRGCPGKMHVARMKQLARDGAGLATYISRRVGHRYAQRLADGEEPRTRMRPQPQAQSAAPQSVTRQNTAFR
jgi:hypothetical protein